MGAPCDREVESSPGPRLVREALIPLPPSVRRPFALIGASIALVFMAAIFDAVLWHYNLEQDELRTRAVLAEQRAADLAARLHQSEIQRLQEQIANAETDEERAAALHKLRDLTFAGRPPCRRSLPTMYAGEATPVDTHSAPGPVQISADDNPPVMSSGRTGKRR